MKKETYQKPEILVVRNVCPVLLSGSNEPELKEDDDYWVDPDYAD